MGSWWTNIRLVLSFTYFLCKAQSFLHPLCLLVFKTCFWSSLIKTVDVGVGVILERAQRLEQLLVLQRTWVWFSAPMSGSSQLPVTPTPEDLIGTSIGTVNTCVHRHKWHSQGGLGSTISNSTGPEWAELGSMPALPWFDLQTCAVLALDLGWYYALVLRDD